MSSGLFFIGAGYCFMFWDDTSTDGSPKASKTKKPLMSFEELVVAGQIPPPFQSPDFKSAWERWEAFRREIGKKITASTATMQIRQLVRMGKALAIESIDQSIRNGWTGLFEVKKGTFIKTDAKPDYALKDEMDRKAYLEALR